MKPQETIFDLMREVKLPSWAQHDFFSRYPDPLETLKLFRYTRNLDPAGWDAMVERHDAAYRRTPQLVGKRKRAAS